MREMKDSGIEWIGEIPKEWKIIRLKYITNSIGDGLHGTPNYDDLGTIFFINGNNLGNRKISITEKTNRLTEEEYKKCGVVKLDKCTLLMSLNGTYGTLSMYDSEPIMLSKSVGYINVCNKETKEYLYYFLQSSLAKNQMTISLAGTTIANLSLATVRNLKICLPPIFEQQQIADFLDTKCSEIDATAEDIQKEISLLEDYKKSVITEAVTKGLNPDAEMKDSGIEWIGNINQKASLCRLKFFSYMKGRIGWQGLKSEDFIDNGPYCVTGTDFINGKINWDTCYHVSEERYKMDSNIQLKIGDLLVTKDGTIGKLAKVTELPEKACLNSHLLIIRPLNERFTNEYLYYVISSDVFVRYYKYSSTGSTMESLSQEKLGNFIFPVYDLLSQQQIVDFLDTKCSEIDTLIADKKRQLDILADYKKSLIYEYVTGKKEVPVNE